MSPGLKRAREPYRLRNALTGIALGAFAVGIWAYSISAVKQDVFDDVDEEARAIARTGTAAEVLSVKEEKKTMEAAIAAAAGGGAVSQPPSSSTTSSTPAPATSPTTVPARGLLQHLDSRFPRLLDPQRKTLVWGAPPVDNIGKMWRP
jgi:cytochrome c oxidase assembly factor 3